MITDRIDGAEVHEQRCEHDQSGASQKSNRQIEVFVCSQRRVEVEHKCGQRKSREVQYERRPPALPENHEQTHEEVNESDEIDVQIERRETFDRAEVVEISV